MLSWECYVDCGQLAVVWCKPLWWPRWGSSPMCLILHLEAVLFTHRWLQCVRLAQARLITGGFASTSTTFDFLMVSVGAFCFVAVFSKGTTFWGVFYREIVCVQTCCPVQSVFELLPVAEKCLLSHIADVIFSHYWWRLSLMRWAGEKQGMALGNDLKQIKLSLHGGR